MSFSNLASFLSWTLALIHGTAKYENSMVRMTNANADTVMIRMLPMSISPDLAIPETTARTIIPRISSMTAAPIMILDSLASVRRISLMTRAVIPTLVATIAAPRNSA